MISRGVLVNEGPSFGPSFTCEGAFFRAFFHLRGGHLSGLRNEGAFLLVPFTRVPSSGPLYTRRSAFPPITRFQLLYTAIPRTPSNPTAPLHRNPTDPLQSHTLYATPPNPRPSSQQPAPPLTGQTPPPQPPLPPKRAPLLTGRHPPNTHNPPRPPELRTGSAAACAY